MDRHEPEESQALAIYVAKDRTCVWIQRPDHLGQPRFQLADLDQITSSWERYRITSLLSVVQFVDSRSPGAGCFLPRETKGVAGRHSTLLPQIFT